jgi:hypothetical protein
MNTNPTNHSDDPNGALAPRMLDIRAMSPDEFAQFGVTKVAYVKPVVVNGTQGFAIHAADGTPMAIADNRDLALAAIVQHELVPVLVH